MKYQAFRFPEVYWDYRKTWKITIGFTPYEILYGKKAILPIDLNIKY